MSVNLLDLFKDQVSGALVSNASKFLGESSENTSSALGKILPSLLGKIVDTGDTEKGASGLMDMLTKQDASVLDDIGGIFSKGSGSVNGLLNGGSGLLSSLLGNKIGGLVDLVSGASGMKSSSTSSLMKMAAPFIFGLIKRQVANKGVSGLMSLLSGQKSYLKGALPKGAGSLLGLSSFGGGDMVDKVTGTASDAVGSTVDAGKKVVGKAGDAVGSVGRGATNVAGNVADTGAKAGGSILKWIIPALLVLAALSYFGTRSGCGAIDNAADKVGDVTSKTMDKAGDMAKGATDAVGDAAKGAADMASSAFSNVNEAAKGALGKIKFAAGSAGSQMMDYIDGGFKGDGKVTFKNLNFATGSAAISGATAAEVDNLAAILKAYPDVKISVDGYTDNTGNADANRKLSKDRAEAVKARLVNQGIAGNRIVTTGKGDANPVASNDTPEGRAQNRRIEATVMK